MRISVGTNWDPELIDNLDKINSVYEIYGCLDSTIVGTGRPSFILGKIDEKDFPIYIKKIHDKGMKFNYNLNASCLNNQEYDKDTHIRLLEQLDWLVDSGIDGVTVTIPYLLELIKRQYPSLYAKVSVITQVNSIQKAKFFESMGADEIVLDYMINRDFKLLEEIRREVKCNLSLLVNDFCLFGCPYRYYHYNTTGHASQQNHITKGFYIDYCAIKCTLERLKNPSLLISSRWIRPEDLIEYENIGLDNFKISGRRMSTKWILNAVNAYNKREHHGNLSEILDYSILGIEKDVHSPRYDTLMNGVINLNSEHFMALGNFNPQRPYIDNDKLDNFINFFKEQKCSANCFSCNYCKLIEKKAVVLDPQDVNHQMEIYSALLDDLTTSKLFNNKEEHKMEQKKVEWEGTLENDFLELMAFAPESLRNFAETLIRNAAVENMEKRNDSVVCQEDMVKAFLENTPAFFKTEMLEGLKNLGVDLDKY